MNSFLPKRSRRQVPRKGNSKTVKKSQVSQMIKSAFGQVVDKFLNVSVFTANAVPATGNLYTPAFPPQGSTAVTRTGDSLHLELIEMRGAIGTSNPSDLVRMLVVQAKSSNTPAITDVLTPGVSGGVDYTSFVDPYKSNTEYHLLYDRIHGVSTDSSMAVVPFHLKLKPKVSLVNFTPGTTTSTQGQVYIILISQLASANTFETCELRYKYHDL